MVQDPRDTDRFNIAPRLLAYLSAQDTKFLLSIAASYRLLGNEDMEHWCLEKAWKKATGEKIH